MINTEHPSPPRYYILLISPAPRVTGASCLYVMVSPQFPALRLPPGELEITVVGGSTVRKWADDKNQQGTLSPQDPLTLLCLFSPCHVDPCAS